MKNKKLKLRKIGIREVLKLIMGECEKNKEDSVEKIEIGVDIGMDDDIEEEMILKVIGSN